jgi:hypothetical protein
MNLGRARNPWTDRSPEESALIWRLSLQWWLGERDGRGNPKTQRAWAKQLDVRQPYVAKMVRRFKRDWLDMADRWRCQPKATLEDVRRLAELREGVSDPQPVAVPHPKQMPQQPQQPELAWASCSAVHPTQIDAAILAYIRFNPNKSKGWF